MDARSPRKGSPAFPSHASHDLAPVRMSAEGPGTQLWRLTRPSPMIIPSRCGRKLNLARRSHFVGAFGEKLRKQREQRGIELDAISNTTKISTRMLRALEDEHFDQLPGGVFNKGFVRAYARQVGLDEEEAISDYLTALRESQIQAQQILPNFRAAKPDEFAASQVPAPVPAQVLEENSRSQRLRPSPVSTMR